ncbi:glycosyltransferase [Sinomonas sp. JGH33]|uniref:Glycosyltransferase n=1 Tax=Sinomonas terricola TaxID=3110330 RepID=A0ABU5T213_9MICC|nr:glycosyltransferase [Sinomonas sp. JGH33]MEA5453703.1 glycosyltransferase [Sinomonas sp. JGH33]
MNPEASVIVPTFNKHERLAFTLESFAHQQDCDFEVVVCDDGSNDQTAGILERLRDEMPYPLVTVSGSHGGAGAARNCAAAAARGDVLVFNDDDMVPAPGYLSRHVEACSADDVLSRGERWAVPIEVVPLFLGHAVDAMQYIEVWRRARMTVAEKWALDALTMRPAHHYRFLQTCTSNLAVRRASFDRIGGFDESFGTRWGAEDTEFGYRAQLAGVGIRLTQSAKNLHLEHSTDSGAKFSQGLDNFRRLGEIHHDSKGISTLVRYVELAVERGHAAELFDEQAFVDWDSPEIILHG